MDEDAKPLPKTPQMIAAASAKRLAGASGMVNPMPATDPMGNATGGDAQDYGQSSAVQDMLGAIANGLGTAAKTVVSAPGYGLNKSAVPVAPVAGANNDAMDNRVANGTVPAPVAAPANVPQLSQTAAPSIQRVDIAGQSPLFTNIDPSVAATQIAQQGSRTPVAPITVPGSVGMPAPAGVAPSSGTGVTFGLTPQQLAAGSAPAAPAMPTMDSNLLSEQNRIHAAQDQQNKLVQSAMDLAGSGKISDMLKAKYLLAGAGAINRGSATAYQGVNPQTQAATQAQTQRHATEVGASTASRGQDVAAASHKYATDVEAYFKLPALQQQQAQAALHAQVAAGVPGAAERLRALSLAIKPPRPVATQDLTGATGPIYDPAQNTWIIPPGYKPPGKGAVAPDRPIIQNNNFNDN